MISFRRILALVARRFGIPPLAIQMVDNANTLSGLGRETLPSELIPLNMMQFSRGLLNFAVLQTSRNWVMPFWVVRQYDPTSTSFVPRAHLGLSMNVTHRNWTAVGRPGNPLRPIVDPRGWVMPFKHGWSLDTWLRVGERMYVPSHQPDAIQSMPEGIPVIVTEFRCGSTTLKLTSWLGAHGLRHQVVVQNDDSVQTSVVIGLSLRPFNPEGVGMIHTLSFDRARCSIRIDEASSILFDRPPDCVRFGNQITGDCSREFGTGASGFAEAITCAVGLANAVAEFALTIPAGRTATIDAAIREDPGSFQDWVGSEETIRVWKDHRSQGIALECPEPRLRAIFESSIHTLLLLADEKTITPGPYTYNQFWFRDAAAMLLALDKTGFSHRVRPIVEEFPHHQDRNGYYRSQQGEWDSNGQAIWTTLQHICLSGGDVVLEKLLPSLTRGARWIDRMRMRKDPTKEFARLLPRGLSAEHLGLADQYFWDDFWGLAGLEAYRALASRMRHTREEVHGETMASSFRSDLFAVVESVREKNGGCITAAPGRGPDAGMIGSIAALYPLQLFPASVMLPTLTMLSQEFSRGELFFQEFVHSGFNLYLSLQIAHAWLYAGSREKFWKILRAVAEVASPTGVWPEAIHPLTGGGVMGDGQHGWAAAEYVLALRDAFVAERIDALSREESLEFLCGIPRPWFLEQGGCALYGATIHGGTIDIHVVPQPGGFTVRIVLRNERIDLPRHWLLRLPFLVREWESTDGGVLHVETKSEETVMIVRPGSLTVRVILSAPDTPGDESTGSRK